MQYKKGDKIVCTKIFRPDGDYWFGGPAKYRPGDTYEIKQITQYTQRWSDGREELNHTKISIGTIGESIWNVTDFLYLEDKPPKFEDYFTDYLKYTRKHKLKKLSKWKLK